MTDLLLISPPRSSFGPIAPSQPWLIGGRYSCRPGRGWTRAWCGRVKAWWCGMAEQRVAGGLGLVQPPEAVAVAQTAVISSSSTGRSRCGCADGRSGQSRHRPKSWWFHGRPRRAVAVLAEAVVVGWTAAMDSHSTGRRRGGLGVRVLALTRPWLGQMIGAVQLMSFHLRCPVLGQRAFARFRKDGSSCPGVPETIASNPAMNPFLRKCRSRTSEITASQSASSPALA